MRVRDCFPLGLLVVVATLATLGRGVAAPSPAGDGGLVIVQPGYPGTTEAAKPFVAALVARLDEGVDEPLGGGTYHNSAESGVEAIETHKPALGVVSMGFFLEHREALAMEPLAWSQPPQPFHLLARKGGGVDLLATVGGKEVTGTPLLEAGFVARILFGSGAKMPADVAAWKAEPARFFSRAIRDVKKDRAAAVLLTDLEYRSSKALGALEELEVLATTESVPVALLVAFTRVRSLAKAVGIAANLQALDRTAEGRELLETMGIERFAAVDREGLQALEARYDEGATTKEGATSGDSAPKSGKAESGKAESGS